MSTNATPALSAQLALVYPALKPGADYRLANDGSRIVMWRSAFIDQPTSDALLVAYTAALATKAAADKITAAETALDALWNCLTPVQQELILNDYVALKPLSDHTAAKLLRISKLEANIGVLALTPAQDALRVTAFTACSAIAAAPAA
jgi:hypothetical protein